MRGWSKRNQCAYLKRIILIMLWFWSDTCAIVKIMLTHSGKKTISRLGSYYRLSLSETPHTHFINIHTYCRGQPNHIGKKTHISSYTSRIHNRRENLFDQGRIRGRGWGYGPLPESPRGGMKGKTDVTYYLNITK